MVRFPPPQVLSDMFPEVNQLLAGRSFTELTCLQNAIEVTPNDAVSKAKNALTIAVQSKVFLLFFFISPLLLSKQVWN